MLLLAGLFASASWVESAAAQSLSKERVCEVLQLDATDCALISGVRDNAHPWRVGNFASIDGDYLFSAASNVAPGMASCLSLDIAEGALPANSRIDFQWEPRLFFEGESVRFYINNTATAAHNVIGGPIGDWHLQQRFAPAAVTELRWCVERSNTAAANRFVGTVVLDLLRFHPAAEAALIADNVTLCAALDLGDCSQLEAFSQDPAVLSWQISDSQSLSGTTALAIPSTVLDGESTCFTIDLDISGRQSLGFNWRLDAPETSTLSLLVNGSERQTLSGTGEDSLWQEVAIFSPVPIESISWCYAAGESAAIARGAWVDALSTGLVVLSVESISALVQPAEAETLEDLTTWEFSLTISAPSGTALPMELNLLSTGEIGATAASFIADIDSEATLAANQRRFDITIRLMPGVELINHINGALPIDLIENYRLATDELPLWNFDLSAYTRLRFCQVMGMEERECALITAIESNEFPWQFTDSGTFSGRAVQSYVGLDDNQRSQLTLTLAAGVTAVSLYRRVSSQPAWDFLAIEYNDNERRFVGELFAPQSYRNLPFFDGDGNRVQGDISGSFIYYTFGDRGNTNANPAINLGPDGTYSHLQLFPGEAIRTLRLLYRKDNENFFGLDRGWLDSLRLYATGAEERPSAGAELCSALEMRDRDCALISSVTTTAGAPWSISNFGLQLSGRHLRSAFEFAAGTDSSCLNLQLSPPLPAATRIDFAWRVIGGGSDDGALFYINDTPAAQGSSTLPWHPQQRLSADPVNTLSWCFMRSSDGNYPPHQLIDRLQFTHAAAARPGPAELCEVLDIPPANCPAAGSFSQNPVTLPWQVSTAQSVAGGNALQIPLTVLAEERSCLELAVALAVGDTVSFSWRSATASGTELNFLVGDSETATLSGTGSDSDWQFVTYTADAAVNSLSWCYSVSAGIEDISGDAWLDSLAIGSAVRIQRISEPLLAQREQNRLTWNFELVLENSDGTALQAGIHDLGFAISEHSADHSIIDTSVGEQRAEGSRLLLAASVVLELVNPITTTITWSRFAIVGLPNTDYNLPPLTLSVPARGILCEVLELSAADCELILTVENNTNSPWQFTGEGTFSGLSLQSHPALPHNTFSDLRFTLAPGVAAVEFYRRVSSQRRSDWLIFEYNGIPRGGRRASESSYRSLPFFGAEGTPVQGDISGIPNQITGYSFGDLSSADAFVNLGPGGEYSLLRLLPDTPLTLTELRWIYLKNVSLTVGEDRGWVDRLQLYPAVTTPTQLCSALDLNAENCPLTAFTLQPPNLLWTIDDEVGLMAAGSSALRVPFRVDSEQTSACLTVTTRLDPTSLQFRWRGGSLTGSQLSFEVNGAEIETLTSTGSSTTWYEVMHNAEDPISTLAWCYSQPPGSDIISEGWIDSLQLQLSQPQFAIAAVTTITAQQILGRYQFTVATQDNNEGFNPAVASELLLTISEADNISTYTVTSALSANGDKLFMVTVQLQAVDTIGSFTIELSHPDPTVLAAVGTTRSITFAALTAEQSICSPLDMSPDDCALISGFATTAEYPWQTVEASLFQSGDNLLASATDLPDDEQSCLRLELSSTASAIRRIDFVWAVDSAAGDNLQLSLNGQNEQPLAFTSGELATAPQERQQRLLSAAPTAISWCYRKDASGSVGEDRGWLDSLSFHREPAANLLPADNAELCAVLNLDDDSCDLLQSFAQQHTGSGSEGLTWAVTTLQSVAGGSALRSPLTVPETAESCLVLQLTSALTTGTELRFQWRVDSAADTDFLRFRAGATVLESISGDLASNPWSEASHTLAQASDELAWCFDDTGAASEGTSLGWIDQLQILLPQAQFAIAAVTTITAQQQLGGYAFTIVTRNNNEFVDATEELGQLLLNASEANNIATYMVTSTLSDNGEKLFMFAVQLQAVDTIGSFTVALSHPDPTLLTAENTTRSIIFAALTAEQSICMPLDLSTGDCGLIDGFATTAEYPWQIVESAFQSGVNLLASAASLPDDEQSCLMLELSAAASDVRRIDFIWAVDSAAGDNLQLSLNGQNEQPLAFTSGLLSSAPHERQQRLLSAAPTAISWCYTKDAAGSAGEDRGWLDSLSFQREPAATLLPANNEELCAVLDLDSNGCELIQSFTQEHSGSGTAGLSWAVTTQQSVAGGSALRSPLTVPETAESCLVLSLAVALPARTELRFQWRVDSAADTDFLRLRAGTAELASISGGLASNPWSEASHTLTQPSDELSWCFDDDDAASAGTSLGWVDSLQLLPPLPQFAIAAMSPPMAQPVLGRYRFSVTARDNNQGFRAAAARAQLQLGTSSPDNIVITTLTRSLPDSGDNVFMLTIQLQAVDTLGSLTVVLNHPDSSLLAMAGTTRSITFAALTAEQNICMPLGLSAEDCDLIDGFATTPEYPWQIVEAESGNGDERLASSAAVADDERSCLTLTLSDDALAAGSRIDFSWAVDSATGDHLQFAINDVDTAGIDGAAIPEHRQQRFSNNAISSLSWCYSKDAAGSTGQDRGWLDSLSLHPPAEAPLLADQQALCTALDLSTADCAALSTYSQSPDSLSWSITDDIALQGDNALQSPLTVTTGESSCLRLQTDLPADTAINFAWRVDSADSSELGFEVNGSPVEAIRMQGTVPDMVGNGWQLQRYTHETALSSLGWCFQRGAMFAGAEQGWLDQLRLEPAFSYPLITLETTPTRADNDSPWVFDIRINVAASQTELPEGLQLITALESNLSTLSITVQSENDQALEVRVETVVEDDSNTTLIRFGFSGLPAAVEPLSDGLTVVIEPQELALVVPVLQALADDGPAENDKVSLGDLLTGFNVLSGGDSSALSSNLPRTNSDLTDDISALTTTIDNPQQRPVLDVDSNGTVDALDFRLMMRYYAGLRGPALCDEVCRIKLESLLEE